MFYEDEEPDNLACLRGLLLFYWYAPRSTATVHRHSSWWWTSVVVRHAQQMAMHRAAASLDSSPETSGIGRRVWWTAFARERLTALCQSKPPIIDPGDCNVPDPSLEVSRMNSRERFRDASWQDHSASQTLTNLPTNCFRTFHWSPETTQKHWSSSIGFGSVLSLGKSHGFCHVTRLQTSLLVSSPNTVGDGSHRCPHQSAFL